MMIGLKLKIKSNGLEKCWVNNDYLYDFKNKKFS